MRTYYMSNAVTGAMRGPFYGDEDQDFAYPWVVKAAYDGPQGDAPEAVTKSTTAHGILHTAAQHMKDRAATYDQPQGERSMTKTVEMFNTLTEHRLTQEQGWLFMVCLKMVRAQQGRYRADSYEDGAAYFALAGESAAQERV